MIRSLFSGVSGMKNHQIRMDVVGNNIANVNTTGYKNSRANFQDAVYQTMRSGGASTNPTQVGLGATVAGISSNMGQGGLQTTGRTLDLAIEGNGFFKVLDTSGNTFFTRDGILNISKDGYLVNSNGYRLMGQVSNTATAVGSNLNTVVPFPPVAPNNTITISGTRADGTAGVSKTITFVVGDNLDSIIEKINLEKLNTGVIAYKGNDNNIILTSADPSEKAILNIGANSLNIPIAGTFTSARTPVMRELKLISSSLPVDNIGIDNEGRIFGQGSNGLALQWDDGQTTSTDADLARIMLFTFANQDGLDRVGKNLYRESSVTSGNAAGGMPGTSGYGVVRSGYLEMSNVDLTDEFASMITTQRGYQSNARVITVSDQFLQELLDLKR